MMMYYDMDNGMMSAMSMRMMAIKHTLVTINYMLG